VSAAAAGLSRWTCRLAFLPLYYGCTWLMRFKAGYVVADLPEIRRRFRELSAGDEPFVICANHLTIIDSAVLLWAFGSGPWYLRNFSKFSWNLPAGDFFKRRLFYRFMGAISKCLYIHRDGSKEHKDSVVRLTTQLVRAGEVVTIFPEGQRSRTGRFEPEKLAYGVGKMVSELGGYCRVLCVYLRSDRQETYSNYPAKGSRFHLEMQLVHARTAKAGREGYKEVVDLIGRTIKDMEDRYFAAR
jgi:1-acyl-sn-glycerol-3-phosphate acyltransferase